MTRADAGFEGPIPDRLREAIDRQDEIFRDTFPGALGVRILDVTDTSARGSLNVDHRVLHPGGSAHGGALAGFGDTVAAWATFPHLPDGGTFTTIEFKANFIAAARDGTLLADATIVHKGSRTLVIDVRITSEADGRLVCAMIVTQALLPARNGD
ncbi:MAG TPA: PaaI family thioesterase [Actinomycetota bacterium]